MSQMKIEEVQKKPVYIGGIRQNCFRLDVRPKVTLAPPQVEQKKYYSLEDTQLPNGFVQEIVEKDYPINSDSVSSYLESSDYRNDPLQAIANAPKRVNLGDITEAQEFIRNNPVEATMQYADILSKVADYFKKQAQEKAGKTSSPAPAPASAPSPVSGGNE